MTTVTFTAKDVQELRRRTGAGTVECKKALEETAGDMEKAVEHLRKQGTAKAEKRAGRTTSERAITSYIQPTGKSGGIDALHRETDFVARTGDLKSRAREIAMHIASAAPLAVDKDGVPADAVARERRIAEEQVRTSGKPEHLLAKIVDGKLESFYKQVALLSPPWIREDKQTIGHLVKDGSSRLGENVQVRRFVRFQMGEE